MPKLIALLIFALLSYYPSSGQLSQKTWMMGGAASYSSSKIGTSSEYDLQRLLLIEPGIGYFLIDKLALGVNATGYFHNYKWESGETAARRLGFGPYLRFYILPENRRLNLFAASSFSLIYYSSRADFSGKSNSWAGTGGIVYFLTQNIGIELGASYIAEQENSAKSSSNELRVNLNLQFHLERNQ